MIKSPLLPVPMLLAGSLVLAAEEPARTYSPWADHDFPRQVLFGDTHSHSSNSPDAFSFGNQSQTPELAYRYARGETLTAHNGMRVRIARPMDFLVISDHAEYLGVFSRLLKGDPELAATELGARWLAYLQAGEYANLARDFVTSLGSAEPPRLPESLELRIWSELTQLNDRFNDPGVFTTFNAYEWTSMPGGNNLHRVVIFRDGADRAGKVRPFSALDGEDPEELWRALASYEEQQGGQAIAIAHNGNLSNGMMFADRDLSGAALTADYARRRLRWEPLYEVTQVKGDGEAHPQLSPDDPYADHETWDQDNLAHDTPKQPWMLRYEYARSALKLGLGHEASLGVNPFQFGLIGGTDIHTGFADPDERNFFGKFPDSEPGPERAASKMGGILWPNWRLASSGYAAVWAQRNTRDSIFEAFKRRETYATTGSRLVVRLFGGWDFESEDAWRPDLAAAGYARGVPMGGELTGSDVGLARGKAPRFLVMATRDPDGANIERLQIIKGWQGVDGALKERVYDIAIAPSAPPGDDVEAGEVPASGAQYSNRWGSAQLSAVWRDPDFDPSQRAFYYLRVLEIETPRWTAYDADYFGLDLPPEVPTVTRERAYTSPIWFRPR